MFDLVFILYGVDIGIYVARNKTHKIKKIAEAYMLVGALQIL